MNNSTNLSRAITRLASACFSILAIWTIAAALCAPASAQLAVGSISPSSAYAGQPGFTLTVVGTGFAAQDNILWNGTDLPATTVVSATELTGAISASQIAIAGTTTVSVVNAAGLVSNSVTFTVLPDPTITSLSPAWTAMGSPVFTLTVNGANFAANSVVTWKGAALATTVGSSSVLEAIVPASDVTAKGTAAVAVTSATAPSTGSLTFTITGLPVVYSLAPSTTLAGSSAFTMTVTGANFTPDESVTWNGATLPTTDVSETQLTTTVPASLVTTAGTANVGAITGGGIVTAKTVTFTIKPDPSITTISPTSALAGSPALTLTVNGANFVSGDVVDWNGKGLGTTYVSTTQLTAHLPASDLTKQGTANVTVVTTTGIVSNSATFTIIGGMALTSISPSSCIAGATGFTMTLTGTGFPKNAVATWDRAALTTTWVSATKLTAPISASLVATPQTANVQVTSATTASTTTLPFTVGLDPILSNITPPTALAGMPSFTLTVNGGQFSSGYNVRWNGVALATTFVSAAQLTATVPAADIAAAGTSTVAVAAPGGITSGTATFTTTPDPVITSISPVNVYAGWPGTTLIVNGTNFTGTCSVLWKTAPIVTTFVSSTELSAAVPASLLTTAGTATVVVQLKGINSNSETFTIDPLPTLTALSPNSVNQGGPDLTVTLTGKNFVTGTVAQWNGVNLATTVVSATSLTAVIPAADTANAGIDNITVENPDTAVTAPLQFRVLVVSDSPLWTQKLLWSHYLLDFTYTFPSSGSGLYNEIYPLDMSSAPPNQSPAEDIQLAQAQGIDGFAVDIVLNGVAADAVMSAADVASPAFYIAPSIDLSTSVGQSATATENNIYNAVKNYAFDAATHPSAARDNGNLVIWTFDTTELPNANWKDLMSRLSAANIQTTWVADLDGLFTGGTFPQTGITNYLGIFQAGYVWSGGRDAFWSQILSLFQTLGHNWCGTVRAGSISPTQYEDAQCTALMRTRWQRNVTDTAETQWADASTWNDYVESTGVNPTSTWNTVRSDITAYYCALFQGRPAPNPNSELYVTSPQAINLNESTTAEAMIINPTSSPVTADIQLFDGNGVQIGTDITQVVAANSVGAATVPIDFITAPAGGYFRANAIMLDANANVLQTVLGAPTIVYPAGAVPTVNVVYYSIPAYNALPGTVGLTLTPNGVTGEATATVVPPTGTNVKFAEILYNTAESEQFFNTTPTTETVSTTGPGFYVARVIDQNRRVGYSNPIYVGP